MENELIIPINTDTKELFKPNGVDTILKAVDAKIKEFDCTDVEKAKDRDRIRSFAAKIVKTKTFLEGKGKDLVKDKKAEAKRLADIKAEEERKAANVNHQKRINNESLTDLIAFGLPENTAKDLICKIAKGKVQHITINY